MDSRCARARINAARVTYFSAFRVGQPAGPARALRARARRQADRQPPSPPLQLAPRGRPEVTTMGRAGGSRDSSFRCLLAIYAAHVLLFHVLAVAPLMGGQPAAPRALLQTQPLGGRPNASRTAAAPEPPPPPDDDQAALPAYPARQLHPQAFVRSSSARLWESSITNLVNNYPKIHVDFSLLSHYFHRVKSTFTTSAWSSSTWGIISGCAIFLLTYTERDHAQ